MIVDAAGCTEDIVFYITEPTVRLAIDSVLVVDSIDCYGDSDGRALVQMLSGSGAPVYSYLWDNGEVNFLANSLTGGWNIVEVTDTRGCLVIDSVNIPENSLIESVLSIIDSVSCYGESDGKIQVSTNGGIQLFTSPFYDYFWSIGDDSTANYIDSLSHGSYYLITRDALGCVVVDSIYLSEPDPLYVNAQEILRVSCYGDSTGQSFAYGVGGTTPYIFTWVLNNIVDSSSTDSSIVNILFAGLETVQLTDARGCTITDTVMIHQPDILEVSIVDSIYAYCIGVNTAELTAGVSGGTAPYVYEWDDALFAPQTTITASNLEAGTYTVFVTDMRGCQDSVTINMDSVLSTMNVSISIDNTVSCYGSNDGALTALASSGQGPYMYEWIGPSGISTNDAIINLLPGNYSVIATDSNGCIVNADEQLIEPAPLRYKVLSAVMNATCLGACDGTVEISLTGGTAPYSGHAQDNNTGTTLMNLLSGDSLFGGICAGDYTISLSDANGCSSELLVGGNDHQIIHALDTIDVAIDPLSCFFIFCNGDSTGGVTLDWATYDTSYSYNWYEANDPSTSLGNMTQIMNLGAGSYVVEANYLGCIATDTMVLTEPDTIQILGSITHVLCFGSGSVSTIVSVAIHPK
jgi:hypothetical protein